MFSAGSTTFFIISFTAARVIHSCAKLTSPQSSGWWSAFGLDLRKGCCLLPLNQPSLGSGPVAGAFQIGETGQKSWQPFEWGSLLSCKVTFPCDSFSRRNKWPLPSVQLEFCGWDSIPFSSRNLTLLIEKYVLPRVLPACSIYTHFKHVSSRQSISFILCM